MPRGLIFLFFCGLVFAMAGWNQLATLAFLPVIIGSAVAMILPFSRPGSQESWRRGRKAHKFNYLGHYRSPLDAIGIAIVITFGVREIYRMADLPFGLVEAILVFSAAILIGWLPDFIGEVVRESVSFIAIVGLLVNIALLPEQQAPYSKLAFFIILGLCSVIVFGVWTLPGLPFFMSTRDKGTKVTAGLALLELAAAVSFPLQQLDAPTTVIDAWAEPISPVFAWTLVLGGFGFLAFLTAWGPRLLAGLIGITLALLASLSFGVEWDESNRAASSTSIREDHVRSIGWS